MKPGELPTLTWQFRSSTLNYVVVWSWRSVDDDHFGRESADQFVSLSEAFADARRHGFNGAHDQYSIV